MSVDDRVRRGLKEVVPADPSGVYERIVERRVRRRIARRMQSVALAIAVVTGTVGGVALLSRAFWSREAPAGPAITGNGIIAYAVPDAKATDSGGHALTLRIYTIEPSGGQTRQIASVEGGAGGLDWSPDGQRLAFGVWQEGGVYVVDADGSNPHRVVDDGLQPSWSPDGERLAYAGYDGEIHVVDGDGSNESVLTDLSGSATSPDWSPDGRSIAFVGPGPEDHRQGWDIYVMDADGSNVVDVTNHPAVDLDPAWSPDGAVILFRSRRAMPVGSTPEGEFNERLYTIHPNGSGLSELTTTTTITQSPVWSPDGTKIAFDDGEHVLVAEANGSNITKLVDGSQPAWQPVPGESGSTDSATQGSIATPTTEPGRDVGLSFNLCYIRTLGHVDVGDGTIGTAWTGAVAGGSCTEADEYVLAVDATGDGRADEVWRSFKYCFRCRPYAATDLDGDGDEEIIVLTVAGTTPRFEFFDLRRTTSAFDLQRITTAPPGDRDAGFPAGEATGITVGGDEGFSGFVACEHYPDAPEIVVGWADGPVDGSWREVHMARLVVRGGLALVLASSSERVAADASLGFPFGTDNRACGVDWNAFD